MPRHLYILITITFLVGLSAGVYGYFFSRGDNTGYDTKIESYFIAHMHGCNTYDCPVYRYEKGGSYSYRYATVSEKFEGTLSPKIYRVVDDVFKKTDFKNITQNDISSLCLSQQGIRFSYEIYSDGMVYTYKDVCAQAHTTFPVFEVFSSLFGVIDSSYKQSVQ
jgi:hypothetical protein